ncbi:uncharacterized protein [Vulpes vulpes]|uniref:Uncharacterized protein isoform X2 n=1 Tax=Vulpes vulpes TaxID=9627 RepID=A0ABM5AZI4_VULVU
MIAPQPLERVTPKFQLLGSSGGCRGGERRPWTGFRHWGQETGRHAASPPSRAHGLQKVILRQALHSCRGQVVDPSSALDLGEARSDRDPRWESPAMPAEPTPGCLQELNPATCSSFGDPGHSEVKDLAQREERRQAEPTTQRPFIGLWGRKLVQGAPRPSGLPSQGLPEPQHLPQGPGWGLGQQRAELQKLLRIEILQRPREEDPQEQKEGCPRGQRGEAPRGENKEVPKRQGEQLHQGPSAEATQALREEVSVNPRGEPPPSERRESPQGQGGNRPECPGKEGKEVLREPRKETPQALQTCPRRLSQARGVDEGEVPTPSPEEGGSPGTSRDFHRSLGEQKPQPAGREGAGSGERTTQLTPGKTDGPRRESAPAGERRAERQAAPDPGGSGRRERPAALPGRPGPGRDPEGGPGPAEQVRGGSARLVGAVGGRRGGARASKAAWPGPPGAEKASAGAGAGAGAGAAQRETALQRLLELHRAAGRRRRQEREQQRLRVRSGAGRARDTRRPRGTRGRRPLTAASPRSWKASALPRTAAAGCTLWGPRPAQPGSRHRQASRGRAAGPPRSCPGGGRGPGAPGSLPRARSPRRLLRAQGRACPVLPPAGSFGPRAGRPGPQGSTPPRRTRPGSGAPCGSSCSKCSGSGPGGCGPSGPGTPRTSSSSCGPRALRSLCLESSAHPSRPPPVTPESSRGD